MVCWFVFYKFSVSLINKIALWVKLVRWYCRHILIMILVMQHPPPPPPHNPLKKKKKGKKKKKKVKKKKTNPYTSFAIAVFIFKLIMLCRGTVSHPHVIHLLLQGCTTNNMTCSIQQRTILIELPWIQCVPISFIYPSCCCLFQTLITKFLIVMFHM